MRLEDIGFYTLSDARAFNTKPNSRMQRCEMIINEYCNFKCPYCKGLAKHVFSDRKKKELSLEEIKNTIDLWCDEGPLENIRFSGEEPTYHKDILNIVSYAKDKGVNRIAISTNGSNTPAMYSDLIKAGCNDFSISLDANNGEVGDRMAGGIKGVWSQVVDNIEWISKTTYVTVGVVLEPGNIDNFVQIVNFASDLGVADIRVIPSAQWNQPLPELSKISNVVLNRHPILKYRVNNFLRGRKIRGLEEGDATSCPLVLDDSIVAGTQHYPCVIYMREQGNPIGKVGNKMREERIKWFKESNTHKNPICKKNCLDVCVDYNKKAQQVLIIGGY